MQPSLRQHLYEESRRRPSEQPASRVYSVFRRITNLHEISVYVLLLYETISQEKPAGFQSLIVYAPISKSTGYN